MCFVLENIEPSTVMSIINDGEKEDASRQELKSKKFNSKH
jgi:hypothetical protein